ncbi:MAG: hypothetical protein QOF48_1736, partial [Verrucomicrobiota bacterium]
MGNIVQVVIKGVDQFTGTFAKATRDIESFKAVALTSGIAIAGAMAAAAVSAAALTQ